MSVATVIKRWIVYKDVVDVFFAAVNGDVDLDLLPPFPKKDFKKWSDWTTAAFTHIDADAEAKLTDTAFRRIAGMLVASEMLAAKIVVKKPSAEDIELVQNSLKVISEVVAADERFHAALGIASALSADIGSTLKA